MKRREFITLLGGASAAWPLAARAQQPEHARRLGVLVNLAENDQEGQRSIEAFRRGLRGQFHLGKSVRGSVALIERRKNCVSSISNPLISRAASNRLAISGLC
jgi:hypothetical protein